MDLKVLTNTNRVLYVIADVTSEVVLMAIYQIRCCHTNFVITNYAQITCMLQEGIKEAIKAGVNKFGNTIGGLVNSGGIGSVDMVRI